MNVMQVPIPLTHQWQARSPERLTEEEWRATVARIRGEFDEMPCLRVTAEQARMLFGLSSAASESILSRLEDEGFLMQTPDGQYVRRNTRP
jgi:hypothetical protein